MFGWIDDLKYQRKQEKKDNYEIQQDRIRKKQEEIKEALAKDAEATRKALPHIDILFGGANNSQKQKPKQNNVVSIDAGKQKKTTEKLLDAVTPILRNVIDIDIDKCSVTNLVAKDSGVYYLQIYVNGKSKKFVMDDGSIFGGTTPSILFDMKDNNFFVPIKSGYEDILLKGLNGNLMSELDWQRVRKYYFFNLAIYTAFDFTNTPKIDELRETDDGISKLNNILSVIYENNMFRAGNDINKLPRMRFESFESIDKFTLVSDKNVRFGYQDKYNTTAKNIVEGEKYVVDDNGIHHYINGMCVQSFKKNPQTSAETPVVYTTPYQYSTPQSNAV